MNKRLERLYHGEPKHTGLKNYGCLKPRDEVKMALVNLQKEGLETKK